MKARFSNCIPTSVSHRFSPYTDCDSRITDLRGKGMNEQILNIRLLIEKHHQYYKPMVLCFLEYIKDGKCIPWSKMINILVRKGMNEQGAVVIKQLVRRGTLFGKDKYLRAHWFRRQRGVRKSQILSKSIFDVDTTLDILEILDNWSGGVEIFERKLKTIRYNDEITLLASNEEELATLLKRIEEVTINCGVRINRYTTKIMVVDRANVLKRCEDLKDYERVNEIIYLGSVISNNGTCTAEINRRIYMASYVMSIIERQWKVLNIQSQEERKECVTEIVFPIFKYASETWTYKNQDRKKIDVFEMKCWRKVLNITRPCMKTNLSIRKKLKISKKLSTWCQLKAVGFFGHIVCEPMRDLERALILCNLKNPYGHRRRGRPPKGWDSVVKKKLGCNDLRVAIKMAHDRKRWGQLSHGERVT
ncbi:hypothetical protein PYW07_000090 [Mythimna separata]|uniref:Reverse transcriptase domain-containing protein n=1 Tax=Mythimna separata TaxID=271217 RepID=A0AAD7Z2N8_MYTSE|nr:hypothetical protein PYW07_000090 [Mythimna separata]